MLWAAGRWTGVNLLPAFARCDGRYVSGCFKHYEVRSRFDSSSIRCLPALPADRTCLPPCTAFPLLRLLPSFLQRICALPHAAPAHCPPRCLLSAPLPGAPRTAIARRLRATLPPPARIAAAWPLRLLPRALPRAAASTALRHAPPLHERVCARLTMVVEHVSLAVFALPHTCFYRPVRHWTAFILRRRSLFPRIQGACRGLPAACMPARHHWHSPCHRAILPRRATCARWFCGFLRF